MMNLLKKVYGVYDTWRRQNKMPLRLEFVVTDYCNLNCRGCTHYSPLAKKEFVPLEQLEANMSHLSKVCGNAVSSLYLIGGETLLYPELNAAMGLLRRYFPQGNLYVFTNGLALPRMGDEFWKVCLDNDIIVALTRYPIKFDYDAVEELCARNKVRCEVFADRNSDSFFRFALDPAKSQNGRLSHFKCYNKGCISIVGDKMYPCSISACVGHLNKAHNMRFEHCEGDYLAVRDITSVEQIKNLRNKPVPFCKYCVYPLSVVPYGPSKREVGEWVN